MLKQLLIAGSLLAGGMVATSGPFADFSWADSPTVRIDTEIQEARAQLDEGQLPILADAEAAVLEAMSDCEAYLDQRATPENAAAWLQYLQLDPLRAAIENDESVAQRGHSAVELELRLRDIYPGLELEAMTSLRDALQSYIAALRYSDPERGMESVQKQLDALQRTLLSDAEDSPAEQRSRGLEELSPAEVARVGQLIDGLADANQASALISKIQSYYSHENIRGWIDGQAVTDAIARPVNSPNPVNDCILGTRMIGQARVDGNVTGQLLPAEGYIRLLVRLDGLFSTTARGYHPPITVDTTGHGRVYAARQIAITEKGVVLGDTVATAELSTQINRINHPLRIVRRIARKQAAAQRPRAEAISREKLRTQVQNEFAMQTAEMASRSLPGLDSLVEPWLNRLDFPSLNRSIGSTSDTVYARANLQRRAGLSAPSEPPSLASLGSRDDEGVQPGNYLAAIQIHQSIVDNTIAQLLAGQTFTPDRILQLASTLDIDLPDRNSSAEPTGKGPDQEADSEQEDYEVDLANFRPVFIEADNQELRIGLRGTRFSQGGRELDQTLEVSAIYHPVRSDDGSIWLSRDDDVRLSFPGNGRLSISQTAIKTNMQKSFNELFPKEMLHRHFMIPLDAEVRALAGRVVKISAIDLTEGWVSIAVR